MATAATRIGAGVAGLPVTAWAKLTNAAASAAKSAENALSVVVYSVAPGFLGLIRALLGEFLVSTRSNDGGSA
jgi:hypothetical protein